jgi:hypothetical protein
VGRTHQAPTPPKQYAISIARALAELLRLRLVTMRKADPDGPGRPEERWFAEEATDAKNAGNAEMG